MIDRTPAQMRDTARLWECTGFPKPTVRRYREAADLVEQLQARIAELEAALRHVKLIAAGAPGQEDLFGVEPLYRLLDSIQKIVPEAFASGEEHKPAVVK